MTDATEDSAQRRALIDGLRTYGSTFNQVGRQFAAWLGLHPTDAAALMEIVNAEERGAPLSPARLATRIGLSSGATATLCNRLEHAGHVVRSRESRDRRVVTLRTSQQMHALADEFFTPLAAHLEDVMAAHPTDTLRGFTALLTDLQTCINDSLADPPPAPNR